MQLTQLSAGAAIDHRPKGVLLAPLRVKFLEYDIQLIQLENYLVNGCRGCRSLLVVGAHLPTTIHVERQRSG